MWRFHAFFTTADPEVLDTVAADKTDRHHAVIEQVHADLKGAALAHLPSGVFTANAAWLVLAVIAFNLTRAAGTLSTPFDLGRGTIREHPSQADHRARASRDLCPPHHPAPTRGLALGDRLDRSVRPGQRPAARPRGLTTQQPPLRDPRTNADDPDSEVRQISTPSSAHRSASRVHALIAMTIGGSGLRVDRLWGTGG